MNPTLSTLAVPKLASTNHFHLLTLPLGRLQTDHENNSKSSKQIYCGLYFLQTLSSHDFPASRPAA